MMIFLLTAIAFLLAGIFLALCSIYKQLRELDKKEREGVDCVINAVISQIEKDLRSRERNF